jgi:hypothetical protein
MEVLTPASGCLIKHRDDALYRYRVHVPASVEFDFLFDRLQGFIRGFDSRE